MHMQISGGVGACSPRKILVFRRSETTSSAFLGMMSSIILCEKLYYAHSQNNTQHMYIQTTVFRVANMKTQPSGISSLTSVSQQTLAYYHNSTLETGTSPSCSWLCAALIIFTREFKGQSTRLRVKLEEQVDLFLVDRL